MPTLSLECDAILFDMDGTLVDSNEVSEEVWAEWARLHGLDPKPLLAIHHGRRPEETLALIYPPYATAENAAWVQTAGESRTAGLKPVPGAVELITALQTRPWAVVTSATRKLAEIRLRHCGFWQGMPLIGAEDVTHGKPAPDGYLAAAAALGVAPARCIVLEDAPAGLQAGNRAGMTTVGILTTHAADALPTPHRIRDYHGAKVTPGDGSSFRLELQTI